MAHCPPRNTGHAQPLAKVKTTNGRIRQDPPIADPPLDNYLDTQQAKTDNLGEGGEGWGGDKDEKLEN